MLLAGLDIGTTGCKISVFETNGKMCGSVYQDYPVSRSHSTHELDATDIWQAVKTVIKNATQQYSDIAGIGITSFGETFVALDKADVPVRKAMLNTDPRGKEQCNRLVSLLGREKLVSITGLNPNEIYSLPKLMWIKENEPELYNKVKHVLLMEDYIVYMLTGNAKIDYSLATRTMGFDVQKLEWSKEVFATAGVDYHLFAEPVPTGSSAGCVRQETAKELGLSENTIIVAVSHDQVAAAIGSGVLDEAYTVDGAGTVQCNTPVFKMFDAKKMAENNYAIVPFIKKDFYVTYAFSYTGGALVKWYVDTLAGYAKEEAKQTGKSVNCILEECYKDEPTGILVLPHFSGAATPYMDGGSKGAIVGLTLAHTQQDIYCALMEGVCYEMRLNQERLQAAGVEIAPLRATGGGANSRVWMQMKADILNVPVTAMSTTEAGATGSAMLVGVAVGVYADLEEAAKVMVQEKETFYPRTEVHEKYEKVYKRYKELYSGIRPLV